MRRMKWFDCFKTFQIKHRTKEDFALKASLSLKRVKEKLFDVYGSSRRGEKQKNIVAARVESCKSSHGL